MCSKVEAKSSALAAEVTIYFMICKRVRIAPLGHEMGLSSDKMMWVSTWLWGLNSVKKLEQAVSAIEQAQ